jgi:acyl-coenzyme A thioesterase PaaI-like protein
MALQPESRHDEPNPPPGFEPLFRTSPFLETVGPLFYRSDPERGLVIGLRIAEKHANARGIAHGGALLVTLADIALGYRTGLRPGPARRPRLGRT